KSIAVCIELNALQGQLALSINVQSIQQYVRMGYFYKSSTPFQNVFELPAGSYAYVSLDNPVPRITKWWNIHNHYLAKQKIDFTTAMRSEEHTSELQSRENLVCRLLLEKH